ncbi:MAG: zinc-dependent alcohol dehydrogenase family protein [Solirubrobacteraceae bacterium]
MRAMIFEAVGEPLREVELPRPQARGGQLLIEVIACGICRTDLHLLDGEVPIARPPRVLGHQIVGRSQADGRLVGVPWLGWTCGRCRFCRSGRENLCPHARFTGCDLDGGMAQWTLADERFCFPIPDGYPAEQAAPLLCAGLIGHRALRACGDARRIGIYGFGASAHIICQVAAHEGRELFAFTREGDEQAQELARELGASWAGVSGDTPPEALEAAIVFAPVGALVPTALQALEPGGAVVCAGIHMSDIPAFPYELLWHERKVASIANLTRRDGEEFLALAPTVPVRAHVSLYPLERVNDALADLREGRLRGAGVIVL